MQHILRFELIFLMFPQIKKNGICFFQYFKTAFANNPTCMQYIHIVKIT